MKVCNCIRRDVNCKKCRGGSKMDKDSWFKDEKNPWSRPIPVPKKPTSGAKKEKDSL
jgi:hypothetical protein